MAPTSTRGWHWTTGPYGSNLQLGSIPISTKPGASEIVVRIKAAAINPVDIQIMNLPVWSYVPRSWAPEIKGTGKDFSGIVSAAGSETSWKKGDEELVTMDTKSCAIVPKPSEWSWKQAAALPLVYLTARTTIESVAPFMTEHKKLVVLGGSSSTGMYAVHLAKARGWHVVSTCSSRNLDFVRSMGADEVIDYTSPSTNVASRVRAYGPEAIIDCVGGTECLGIANRYVTIVGDKTGRSSMGGQAIYLWNPQMVLRHFLGYLGLGKSYACVNLDVKNELLEETLRLPKEKIVVDSEWGFEEAREAFERLNTGRARGKVVIEVSK